MFYWIFFYIANHNSWSPNLLEANEIVRGSISFSFHLLSIKDNTEVTDVATGVDFESYNSINKNSLAEFEVGYAAGVGVQIPLGLSLNLRYNGSISALAKDDNGDELANARNSVYQATIGFKLPTGTK